MSNLEVEARELMSSTGAEAAAVIVVNGLRGTGCSVAVHPLNDSADYRLKLAKALEMLAGTLRAEATGGRPPQGLTN